VSWHATPFEERLLKVLSSEKPCLERYLAIPSYLCTKCCLKCAASVFFYIYNLVVCSRIKLASYLYSSILTLCRKINGKLIDLEENAE
jgi:hypothetical protein